MTPRRTGGRRPTVAVLYRNALPPCLAAIRELADVRLAQADGLAAALDGAEVLFQWHSFSPALQANWTAASTLEWVHVSAAGVNGLLFEDLVRSDVTYTNSRGVLSEAVAEFTLGLILDLAKDARESFRLQQERRWEPRLTRRIRGASVLVVGTGSIGREIARLCRAAGMRVSGAGRESRAGDADFEQVHSSRDLSRVAGNYDYVVLAAPLTAATAGMVDAGVLAAMKPSACLVNVGRGELVSTDALAAALDSGGIAGAALDVVHPEPLPAAHPLWDAPNVIITPHMSGDTEDHLEGLGQLFIANLRRFCRGEQLLNIVDKDLGFVPRG